MAVGLIHGVFIEHLADFLSSVDETFADSNVGLPAEKYSYE